MKRFNFLILDIIAAILSIGLFCATVWLWRSLFVSVPVDTVTEIPIKKIDIPLADNLDVVVTSTNKTNVTTTTLKNITKVSSSTISNTSTRTIVSELTGVLELTSEDINLDVPYTSQAPERIWADPWENACEEAAALMLDAYYKGYGLSPLSAKDELQKMVDWEQAQGWATSVGITHIKKLLTDYFHTKRKIRIVENPTVAQIKKFLTAGHPVLAVADGKVLPNRFYSNGGPVYHAFIIRGFTKDKFITNDPGVNRGKDFVFNIPDVMNSIHDWNEGDVKNGKKVVLIVE